MKVLLFFLSILIFPKADAATGTDVEQLWSRDFEGFTARSLEEEAPSNINLGEEIRKLCTADAEKIRAYVASRPTGETQNIAIIRIIEVDGHNHLRTTHQVPGLFISGWNAETTGLDTFASQGRLASAFGVMPHRFLGEFYPEIPSDNIITRTIEDPSIKALRDDFAFRGRHIDDGKYFGTANYAHSEQAFLSCVFKGKCQVGLRKPKCIILLITSHLPACDICDPTLTHVLEDDALRNHLIEGLYPHARDTPIPIHLVYAAADLKIETPIDFRRSQPYFINTRA